MGDVICYPSHLGLTFSFELLWFVSPPCHPKYSLLCSCSPPRVVEPGVPAAIRSDADLCHQGIRLGKDTFRPAKQFEQAFFEVEQV